MKHIPLTKLLLNAIANTGSLVVELGHMTTALATHYGSAYRRGGHEYVTELKKFSNQKIAYQTLQQLKRSRYVTARKMGNKLILELTDKGRFACLVQKMRSAPKHTQNSYTMVIFDIPETERASRLQLRTLLKQSDFVMLQHSVWISNRDSYKAVADFIRYLRLERWVNVYHATDLLRHPKFS